MFFLLFCFFFAQTNCRGAAQFLLCRNATSRLSTFRLQYHLYFSTQCLAQKIYNIVCFFSFVTNPSPAASMSGCRGRPPTHLCLQFVHRKIASLFADLTLYKKLQKRCRDLFSDTALFWVTTLYFFFYYSAPLSRLTPNEALPISCERSRTRNLLRQGLCPLTPQALWRRA